MEPADVTVVIPAYRAAATIGRALASVAAQTLPPSRVVVVDDGSPDDTALVAEGWKGRMGPTELVVIRQANAGAGAARNRAIRAATTEWLAFLDADDEWRADKLEACLEAAASQGLDFVSTDMQVVEPGGGTQRLDCARWYRASAADPFLSLFLRGWVATSTVVARRGAVAAAGGFDPSLRAAQDYDLWLAMMAGRDLRVGVVAEPLTRYHLTEGSITTNVERRRLASLAVLRRHAHALRARGPGAGRRILIRALIISYEAMSAHRAAGRPLAAAVALVAAPFRAAAEALRRPQAVRRPDFLADPGP